MASDTSRCPFINLPSQYKFTEVDHKYSEVHHGPVLGDPPSPGPLQQFQGSWTGVGFNTIFRPNNFVQGQNTTFANPIKLDPRLGNGFDVNNVLELNVTKEQIAFTQNNNVSHVPNRGSSKQGDIFLAGVAYFQVVSDMLNPDTFKADTLQPNVIHLEPGLWMAVPASTEPLPQQATIIRMGSIPHGTTINCTGPLSKVTVLPGPPKISAVSLIVANLHLFNEYSLDVENSNTPRIPQDLTQYVAAGTITQEMLSNPSSVLTNANKGLDIIETTTIDVCADIAEPSSMDSGSGIVSIPFLESAPSEIGRHANARVVCFSCTFWIEKVRYRLTVPPCRAGQPFNITPPVPNSGSPPVTFEVNPPRDITKDTQVVVESFQLQYRQKVTLSFSGFSWPHVSVGTLVPDQPVVVPMSVFG